MRHAFVALALIALLGCGDGLAPTNQVSGTWDAHFSLPGAGLVLTLDQTNVDLTGSGSYSIEAGRSGTLQLNGTYQRPSISVVLHYDYGAVLTYTGTVIGDRNMSGTLADSLGRGSALTFTRR